MGHSQADKAQSRERILAEAAGQIRDAGLESVSVARLMRSAGLTHGGFYGHFASRDELLAQALERALVDGAAASRAAAGRRRSASTANTASTASTASTVSTASTASTASAASRSTQRSAYDDFVRHYLSRAHREARKDGCAVAALAADAARADAPVREVMAAHVERFVARVAELARTDDDEALFAVSALVGGLLLSRVIGEPARADALLRAVREGLQQRPSGPLADAPAASAG
ncbi:TetR/AcrR family transcriptional regulator [Aquabacterium sp. OR-4]|uniref:TetR/AcrR family transcriptional regulator n=1 Tax=Aquabacterium sp. OR-4 TaxID=2978127 RepID=UPI0021B18BD9|nr:helix-turn-helix domain-containing protein [Aquabacterium sp. OR-4]MDT7835505.1 helix-turn-helix domain-containing protein [Aquabacterium sp. OR-4]